MGAVNRPHRFINVYERNNGAFMISYPGGKPLPNEKFDVVHYMEDEKDIFEEWLKSLRDTRGGIAVDRAVARLRTGNFGKGHFCRDGVWELVIDVGPGYRVYYALVGKTLVILLCAGTKRTQDKDIEKAVEYLRKYKEGSQNDNLNNQP